MKRTRSPIARGLFHSLAGLCIAVSLTGYVWWITKAWGSDLARHALLVVASGAIVWLHLVISYALLLLEYRAGTITSVNSDQVGTKTRRIQRVTVWYHRFGVIGLEVGVCILLAFATKHLFTGGLSFVTRPANRQLLVLALSCAIVPACVIITFYFSRLTTHGAFSLMRPGRNHLLASTIATSTLLGGIAGRHFGIPAFKQIAHYALAVLSLVLVVEIIFAIVIRFFRPRRRDELPRSALDSYILEGLAHPLGARATIVNMLHDVFGFDVSRTTFFRLTALSLIPLTAASVLVMIALSSITIIKPNQRAVSLRFGVMSGEPLGPGIHIAWPWPAGERRIYDTESIRKVHVGSHQVLRDGDVFKEGVPLLWTNAHGISGEELLIVSAPASLMDDAAKSGGQLGPGQRQAPSISLAGADICVEYVIADVASFVTASAQPDSLMATLAEAEASRILYRYDIDSLFSAARLAFAEVLANHVQREADRCGLGVTVVHAGMTAVHPPLPVAGAFEETVAAQQERETKIQEARQRSIQDQIESAGTAENFARLTSFIDSAEASSVNRGGEAERLVLSCGGEVSRILAEAAAYRLSRICAEQGKRDRFVEFSRCHRAAPSVFEINRYLSVLESTLATAEKTVVLAPKSDLIIDMGGREGKRVPVPPIIQK